MIDIPYNFNQKNKENQCITGCGQIEDMNHIYICERLKTDEIIQIPYDEIYGENLLKVEKIFKIMKKNIKKKNFSDVREPMILC